MDRESWLQRVRELRGSARDFLRSAPAVQGDREVVLALVKKDGLALEWAAESLRADPEVVLAAVRKGAFALQHAAVSLRRDRSFVLQAVRCNGYALGCAGRFQGDRHIVEAALREDGSALEYAAPELRAVPELALLAVASDAALEHVAPQLWRDRRFAAAALAQNEAALQQLPDDLLGDRSFLLDAVAANPKVLSILLGEGLGGQGGLGGLRPVTEDFLVQCLRRNAQCFAVSPGAFADAAVISALSGGGLELLAQLRNHGRLQRDFLRSAVEATSEVLRFAEPELRRDPDLVKALACRRASALQHADPQLRSDENFLLSLVELNAASLRFCSEALATDHDFNLKALQRNALARDHVDATLWSDASFVLKALQSAEISTRTALERVSAEHPELLADADFALRLVETRGSALEFLAFRDDRALVAVALEDDPRALAWASPTLQDDHSLVLPPLRKDGAVLRDAGPSIRDDVTMVLEATRSAPGAFQFASDRLRNDQDVVWQALKISPRVLAFSPLAADGNFVLSAAMHYEAAVQYAAEALLGDLGFCLSCVAQNAAVLGFLPELRASNAFVEAAVKANGQALYFAARHFQSDPSLIRLSNGPNTSTYPSALRRDAETLRQHGVPLERLGGEVHARAAGNRILYDWERLDRLSPKALQEECSMRGLPSSCLEWYGVDFLTLRLKKLILLQELSMPELQRCVDSNGGAGALHSLRLGASVRVVEDFFSIGNVKLKRGLVGKVVMLNQMDAKIDFKEQNTSAGAFAAQWVYQKDFIRLKLEEDEEQQSILLNELLIDLFAGIYERKGVPVRSLRSFPAASAVLERWESLAEMADDQLSTEFLQVFGIGPGALRRDAQESALCNSALWREMPVPQLLKECEKHKVGLPSSHRSRSELQDLLLGSLCKDLYKAEGVDLQVLGLSAAAALLHEWNNLDKMSPAKLSESYAALKLPNLKISEKEQRERLKKVCLWKALPFTALREHCWNMGMRSAYFNSADFCKDRLVREAAWHQWSDGSKSPWSEPRKPAGPTPTGPPPPEREKERRKDGGHGVGPNGPFEYLPAPSVPAEVRSCLQRLLLPTDASVGDVKKAYRKLALKYHPDKNNKDETMERIAAQHFMEIRSAYDELLAYFDEPG